MLQNVVTVDLLEWGNVRRPTYDPKSDGSRRAARPARVPPTDEWDRQLITPPSLSGDTFLRCHSP